jgi:hypothetical protein
MFFVNKMDLPFCLAAFMSFIASVALWFLVDQSSGIFVGLWVPSILAFWCGIRLMLLAQKFNTKGD